jgi:hypothetical protein
MFELQSYFDESEDEGVLLVAGVGAPLKAWASLEARWQEALADEGLPEFHAHACHKGTEAFRGPRWEESSGRLRVRDRFLDIIASTPGVISICAGVDLEAFETAHIARKILNRSGYNHPYYLAFASVFQGLLAAQALLNVYPHLPGEPPFDPTAVDLNELRSHVSDYPLGTIVDRNDQRERHAREIHHYFQTTFVHLPIGGIAFEDSVDFVGLQVADLVAYEARCYLVEELYGRDQGPDRSFWPRGIERIVESEHARIHLIHFDASTLAFTEDSFDRQRHKTRQAQSRSSEPGNLVEVAEGSEEPSKEPADEVVR